MTSRSIGGEASRVGDDGDGCLLGDKDVPIWDFLKEIEARGEDPSEYRTIWYYY